MGKFGEDEEIEAETLYQLWIAEGMVLSRDKSGEETMMEVAELYMGELVHKSMVQVKFEDDVCSQRKFKSCQLHDLMRDLSLSIAKEEDFFKVVRLPKVNDFHFDPSVGLMSSSTRQVVVSFDAGGYKSIKYNLFFSNKDNQRHVRSFLLFDHFFANRSLPRLLGSQVLNFKLLRVFALEGVNYLDMQSVSGCFFYINLGRVLGNLVYLRYLSLRRSNLLMFPSIQKLELLETLKVDIPYNINFSPWLSRNILGGHLRHLYLPHRVVRSLGNNLKLRFNRLSKLETPENFDTTWCEVMDLPKLISLQKLTLKVEGSYYDVEEIIKYMSSYSCLRYLALNISMRDPGLDMLRQLFWNHEFDLQKLLIKGKLPELTQLFVQQQQQLCNTHINVSLIRITSLSLWHSHLEEDPMPILEKISTLRELDMNREAFVGKEMVCSAMGFPKVKTHPS